MFGIDAEEVKLLRKEYPVGSRIVVDCMENDPNPIEPGTKGTVVRVDSIGTIHCNFDNGRYLGVIPGEDSFHKIHDRDKDER